MPRQDVMISAGFGLIKYKLSIQVELFKCILYGIGPYLQLDGAETTIKCNTEVNSIHVAF